MNDAQGNAKLLLQYWKTISYKNKTNSLVMTLGILFYCMRATNNGYLQCDMDIC